MNEGIQGAGEGAGRPDPDVLSSAAVAGESGRRITGGNPLDLEVAAAVWLVADGIVDVFLAESEDGRPAGRRHHLFTAAAGDLLFGVARTDDEAEVRLLGIGSDGAVVRRLDRSLLDRLAREPAAAEALIAAVDRWGAAVTDALVRSVEVPPVPDATVEIGTADEPAARTVARTCRLAAPRAPAWLRRVDGVLHYLDLHDIPASDAAAPFPLYPGSWLLAAPGSRIEAVDTAAALSDGRLWQAVEDFVRLLLTVLPLQLRLAAADRMHRERDRLTADRSAAAAADRNLAAVLRPGDGRVGATADPLFAAFAAVATELGIEAAALRPARPPGGDGSGLEALLHANRLRRREITLQDGWWRQRAAPFVAYAAEDGRPLAVLPRLRGGHTLFDPATGRREVLTAARARALADRGDVIYGRLPFEPLRARDLLDLILRTAPLDITSILGFGLVAGVLGLAPPIAIGYLVDQAIPDHDMRGMGAMAGVLLAIALVMLIVRMAVQIAALRLEGIAGINIQAGVVDRLLRLPATFFKPYSAGDLMVRTLAVRRIQNVVTASMIGSVLNGVLGVFALGLLAWYDATLSLVAVGLILLFVLFSLAVAWLRIRREREVISLSGAVSGLTLQMTAGIAKLRLAGAEDRVLHRWSELYSRLAGHRDAIARLNAVMASTGAAYSLLATVVIFAVIWRMDPAGGAPEGIGLATVLAFLSAYGMAFSNILGLTNTGIQIAALAPVLRHAEPILQARPEVDPARADPGRLSGGVELSHVGFRYGDDMPRVFQDLTLRIEPGEFVAVVGPSGCGKSTLIRLLLGLEEPETGAVLYDGADLRGLDVAAVRRQIGVVAQSARLMSGTILSNITGADPRLSEEEAWEAARLAGVAEDIRAMPMGMQTLVTDGGAFSGGQAQRIHIARAVAARPRILVLDEATSALDNRTQAQVTERLNHLAMTRLVVAHRLSTVVDADRIVVLDKGRIVETGRFEDLVHAGGLFQRLAERQTL